MSPREITLDLSRCHFPVNGLGFGRRVGVWFQGCSIHCPGCIVPETWEAGRAHRTPLRGLLHGLLPWLDKADGVTISGGEPFDQPESLYALLSALRTLTTGDLLVYSGYTWGRLMERYSKIVECCDVVVSEPFRMNERGEESFIGSSNQRLHQLTALGRARYADWNSFERRIDIAKEDGALRMVGIPKPGQLQSLCEELNQLDFEASLTHVAV